jgi:hypothetical protein
MRRHVIISGAGFRGFLGDFRGFRGLRARALALLLPLAACGSSGSGDAATPFVGAWTFDTGSADATCTGIGNMAIPLAGLTGTITKVDNTHIRLEANTSCVITFSVSGSVATADPGQSCTLPVPNLGAQPIGISSWTLTLAGSTLTATIQGTALAGLCTAMGGGSLTKHPPSDGGADATTSGDASGG